MKYLYFYVCVYISLIIPHTSNALTQELQQLQQSFHTLTQLLSKSQTPKTIPLKPTITTYEELKKIVDEAYNTKNPSLLDSYEQTVALVTAKYLLQEFIKEGPLKTENRPEYIPLISYITQQITEQYPDKNLPLSCASLAAGNLENEFLLIRALHYIGYKNILLVAIDILYDIFHHNPIKDTFKIWCESRNIPFAYFNNLVKDNVNLRLFRDSYDYIQTIYQNKLPKNNCFLMIQPSKTFPVGISKSSVIGLIERTITPNYLSFRSIKSSGIQIYLPYKRSDFFITSDINENDQEIKNMQNVIKEWPDVPLYQKNLMIRLANNFFGSFGTTQGSAGSDVYLSFYDLILHTAAAQKPLAFETLNLEMKQITDMSGSMQDIYNRYKRP